MENIQEHKQTVGTMESYIKYIMSISKYKMHQHLYINSYNKRLTKIFEVDDKIIFEMNPKLYLENDVQSSMFSIGSISNVEFIKDAYKIWCNENLEINIIQKESFKNNKIKNYKFIKPNELDKNYHLLNGMSAKYEKNKDDELIRIILYKKN